MNSNTTTNARSAIDRFEDLLSEWRSERNSSDYNPVPFLSNLADLLEEEVNIFFSTDPDPFDDRHPLRTDSSCDLGQILRMLSSHDSLLARLTYIYLPDSRSSSDPLIVTTSRLLCAMRLGVTLTYSLDEDDVTIRTLYRLALSDDEPTNCYALFLLGSILDNTELLYVTRQNNMQLIPVVVQRLTLYTQQLHSELSTCTDCLSRREISMNNLLGHFHLKNPTIEMKIRLSIAYLLPVAEYQDLMPFMYNDGILDLIYTFLSPAVASRDIRLTFEALRLLGNLMCHRCVYLEFVDKGGLQIVLQVPRPSVAATAVSIVLYYTAYFEDAMERVCQLPSSVLTEMIKYSLWLVECSHPSARCYSLFFLNLVLCYGVTFKMFESQNGLVYLYNAICVLPLRLTEDYSPGTKDNTSWHVVRASLCAIRRFLEISLLLWIDSIDSSLASLFDEPPRSVVATGYRPITYTADQLSRLISLLIARIRPNTIWPPTQQLKQCGAIDVLYRIIARNVYAHNTWPCRNECTRLAVDILNLMAVTYDLADEITSSEVCSLPSGTNSATAGGGVLMSSPLFNSLNTIGESPRSGDVTVHLPSPNDTGTSGGTATAGGSGLRRTGHRGLLGQLLDIVEQFGSSTNRGPNAAESAAGHRRARRDPNRMEFNGADTDSGAMLDTLGTEVTTTTQTEPYERVNGLHMLFSISRETDDGWDVSVHKSILSFVCTLVYRPIVEHEHPDNPIPAARVLGQLSNSSSTVPSSPALSASPHANPGAHSRLVGLNRDHSPSFKMPNSIRNNRKRRHDDAFTQSLFISQPDTDRGMHLLPQPTSPQLRNRCSSPSGFTTVFSESSLPASFGQQKSTELLYRQAHLWHIVRRQHGIMALLYHLETKEPISDADSVRTLACRGLVGLARSEEVRSMLAKMPLFTKALLQLLMKEPVLPDRLTEHAEFCRYAAMLISLVVGTLSDSVLYGDMSLERVRRAEVVAKTRIQWDQEELLELIYKHLHAKGFHNSAATLKREARLKVPHCAPSQLPLYDDFSRPPGETPPYQPTPGCLPGETDNQTSLDLSQTDVDKNSVHDVVGANGDSYSTDQIPQTPNLRLVKVRPSTPMTQTPKACRDRFERPSIPNLYLKPVSNQPQSEMTLSRVVESFLLHQHAQCPHPVSVCPKFSLYHAHRCPDPRLRKQSNVCQRLLSREFMYGSTRLRPSRREDRHFLHRRFQPMVVIREAEDDLLTACCFSRTDDGLFLGTTSGAIAWVNVEEDGMPVELFHVQTSSINRLAHTRDGQRLLVCSEWGEPATVVAQLRPSSNENPTTTTNSSPWEAVSDDFVFHVAEARYAEFSNTGTQDRLVATYGKMAKVFDLVTGTRIADLYSPAKQSGYMLNKATFSPCDRLILNDGVVWDLRCSGSLSSYSSLFHSIHHGSFRPVHKIDKLQNIVSGVFHPNCSEIIVGSAVWDIRTWRLLHTIQALDRLEVQFNATQDVIYAGNFGWDEDEYAELGNKRMVMQNMFRTLDALDYSLIASVDVRHRIEHLALDTTGQSLALVEKVGESTSNEPITQCRIYMVGRKRSERDSTNEDEEAREEDDEDEDADDDDDDDDDENEDDDLMNAETVDELVDILDGSSMGGSSTPDTSDFSDSSGDSSLSPPHRHLRRGPRRRSARLHARQSRSRDTQPALASQEAVAVEADQPPAEDDEDGDSSWETMDEEEISDPSGGSHNE